VNDESHAPPPGPPPSDAAPKKEKGKQQFRRIKRDVHGWIVLDKPVGMTSTHAVAAVRRLY
jgi:tRNA pseudouridine55 synthase